MLGEWDLGPSGFWGGSDPSWCTAVSCRGGMRLRTALSLRGPGHLLVDLSQTQCLHSCDSLCSPSPAGCCRAFYTCHFIHCSQEATIRGLLRFVTDMCGHCGTGSFRTGWGVEACSSRLFTRWGHSLSCLCFHSEPLLLLPTPIQPLLLGALKSQPFMSPGAQAGDLGAILTTSWGISIFIPFCPQNSSRLSSPQQGAACGLKGQPRTGHLFPIHGCPAEREQQYHSLVRGRLRQNRDSRPLRPLLPPGSLPR